MTNPGRVLGVDLGLKRTGLAISDELGLCVRLLPNLLAHSRQAAVDRLLVLVREHEVTVLLIGIPEERTEHSRALASRVRGLKEALERAIFEAELSVRVLVVNEAHSSRRASERLVESAVKKKQRKEKLDAASAAILVEDYLASVRDVDAEDF
jgi:putative Holliday junction resolvase